MKIKSISGKCWCHSFTSYPLSKEMHRTLPDLRDSMVGFIIGDRLQTNSLQQDGPETTVEGFGGVLMEQRRPKRNSSQGSAEGLGRGEETFPLTFCKMICIVLVTKRKCLPGEAGGFRVEAGCRKERKMWIRAFCLVWSPRWTGIYLIVERAKHW